MSEELYQKALVELARASTTPAPLADATDRAERDNPLCGDRVAIEARLEGGRAAALSFNTRGCVLCQAASTLAARKGQGWSGAEAGQAAEAVKQWLKGAGAMPWPELAPFVPVQKHKSRHDCVTLPFETLRALFASSK